MLIHDFISISKEDMPENITYKLTHGQTVMHLSDDIIVNNESFFSNFSAYWDEYNGKKVVGINYYGITIITNDDLEDFIAVLEKHADIQEVQKLIEFCRDALENKKNIIHFGI